MVDRRLRVDSRFVVSAENANPVGTTHSTADDSLAKKSHKTRTSDHSSTSIMDPVHSSSPRDESRPLFYQFDGVDYQIDDIVIPASFAGEVSTNELNGLLIIPKEVTYRFFELLEENVTDGVVIQIPTGTQDLFIISNYFFLFRDILFFHEEEESLQIFFAGESETVVLPEVCHRIALMIHFSSYHQKLCISLLEGTNYAFVREFVKVTKPPNFETELYLDLTAKPLQLIQASLLGLTKILLDSDGRIDSIFISGDITERHDGVFSCVSTLIETAPSANFTWDVIFYNPVRMPGISSNFLLRNLECGQTDEFPFVIAYRAPFGKEIISRDSLHTSMKEILSRVPIKRFDMFCDYSTFPEWLSKDLSRALSATNKIGTFVLSGEVSSSLIHFADSLELKQVRILDTSPSNLSFAYILVEQNPYLEHLSLQGGDFRHFNRLRESFMCRIYSPISLERHFTIEELLRYQFDKVAMMEFCHWFRSCKSIKSLVMMDLCLIPVRHFEWFCQCLSSNVYIENVQTTNRCFDEYTRHEFNPARQSRLLQSTENLDIHCRLNRAGRRYLQEDPSNLWKASNVFGSIGADDVDARYVLLKENPSFVKGRSESTRPKEAIEAKRTETP